MLNRSLLFLTALLFFSTFAPAQDGRPDVGPPPDGRDVGRPNLLAALNLSPEQVQELRRLNQQRKPQTQAAQLRFREANRALDDAIYSDNLNESDVAARIREFQAAQAELANLRFQNELAVRKILTPDQLMRFREMRRNFEAAREKFRRNGAPPDAFRPRPNAGQRPPIDH